MTTVARSRPTTRVASHSRAALLSFGLLVLTAGLLVMSFALPIFRVSRVQIVGRNLPAREIASVAGVSGRNIFTIRGSEVAVNVARIPNILVTGVDVSLPNVVVIRATLRRGLFAWREAKSLYLVDAYGRLISRVETTSLPVVYNQTGSSIGLGGYVIPAVAEAVPYIRHALPRAGIRSFIFNPRRGLVLHSTQ
ncbi:MAG TPA: hypothetical protein VFB34_02855, partial [Chloroflexota bacterium]|nr:hypothetical protein [Chloroflexota bacterium]